MELPSELRFYGRGFIDEVSFHKDPSRRGHAMVINREYERLREGIDLAADEPWVQWRRALQGGGYL